MHQFQKALLTLLLSALAATVAVTAKAQIICNNWGSGGSTGQCIYDCNFSNGSYGGSYGTSYDCYSHNNYCTINFTGGNSYQGPCSIVFTCYNGTSYYCEVNNWNGKEPIQCDNIPPNCNGVYVCPSRAPVPEPSTWLAGALLLVPLGFSAARTFRKHKAVCDV